jgi:hypothetical protein
MIRKFEGILDRNEKYVFETVQIARNKERNRIEKNETKKGRYAIYNNRFGVLNCIN